MTAIAPHRRIIGLTGGIATGKTTVSTYLATECGIPVCDADRLARAAVAPGMPALQAIAVRYGTGLLQPDGSLNRRALGEIIFGDPAERRWLEAQIHPWVRARLAEAIASTSAGATLVLDVPLLFEAHLEDLASETWVVACSSQQQIERLQQRDGLSERQARARIAAQMPLAEKIARADCILENSGEIDDLLGQVNVILRSPRTPPSLDKI